MWGDYYTNIPPPPNHLLVRVQIFYCAIESRSKINRLFKKSDKLGSESCLYVKLRFLAKTKSKEL